MSCNNIETLVYFALQGRGITCLPEFSIKSLLGTYELVEVLPKFVDKTVVFHILWPASKHPSPKVRAFVDFLSKRILEKYKEN